MFTSGISLGILTFVAWFIIWCKLPRNVRRFISKHSLASDLALLIATYMFLGGTITALFAAGTAGLLTSGGLYIANNPDDFIFLSDLRERLKEVMKATQSGIKRLNDAYVSKRDCSVTTEAVHLEA